MRIKHQFYEKVEIITMLIWRCSNHVACCGTLCYPYAVRTLRPKTTRAAALVGCGSRYVAAYCAFVCMLSEVVCQPLLIVSESSVSVSLSIVVITLPLPPLCVPSCDGPLLCRQRAMPRRWMRGFLPPHRATWRTRSCVCCRLRGRGCRATRAM